MRKHGVMAGMLAAVVALAGAEGLPPLPEWDPEDADKVRKGDIVPGSELLREGSGGQESPIPQPEILTPEGTDSTMPERFPREIAPEFLEAYFADRPEVFLVDPQDLLSRQEYRDLASFLEFHAGDSSLDLHVYLFDARQELPPGVSIESVFREHFAKDGPHAVAFYFLGVPEKSRLVVGDRIRSGATGEERERALKTAIRKAFEKSAPSDQLDNFLAELSIRLYWFEKTMKGASESGERGSSVEQPAASTAVAGAPVRGIASLGRFWAVGVLLLAVLLGWLGRLIARRRLRYVFPGFEQESLLGAPHAAGVGSVVSFSNAQLPPSQQRDQVPDYLQRM
jgi:hypothetical protein